MMYPKATAYIKGAEKFSDLGGKVEFYQRSDGVLVEAEIYGLPSENISGFFAFHIHEGPSCGGENFGKTGAHFNPKNTEHPRHAGDLPPLLSYNGSAYMQVVTNRFDVNDIIGKTVVIHSKADDFTTQPSGNAGEKIACGIIMKVLIWRKIKSMIIYTNNIQKNFYKRR